MSSSSARQDACEIDVQRLAADADRGDRVMVPVAEALLSAARLQPGQEVLDVGCGGGAVTLLAAERVAPGGAVTGVDVSAPMLQVARNRQTTSGLSNVEFVQADAQTHTFSHRFDVAVSRFGTMFFTDPTAAFTALAGALRSGALLALATWQPLTANDWLIVPAAPLLRYGTLPAVGDEPGMFAQADPAVVERVLAGAGFVDIRVTDMRLPLLLGADVEEAIDYLATSGPGRAALATVPLGKRDVAIDGVRAALADHVDQAGVRLDAAVWLTTATRAER